MSDVYAKLKELGLELPKAPAKGGVYSSSRMFAGNLVYISGCGPVIDGQVAGKVGKEFTKEEAYVFSRNSMLNVLAVLQDRIGDLNKVKQVVKILVMSSHTLQTEVPSFWWIYLARKRERLPDLQ